MRLFNCMKATQQVFCWSIFGTSGIVTAFSLVASRSCKPVYASSGDSSESRQRRQQSLQVGHHPLLSLNINLDALAQAKAPDRAQELYQRISSLHEEGYYAVRPDVVSFNSVLKAYQEDPEGALEFWEEECHRIQPNVRSYNTFLLALANAGLAGHADTLLRQMQENNSVVPPDRITFNTVLLAHCVSDNELAAEKAQSLLAEMIGSEHVKPDAISFNTVIAAWAARQNKQSAVKAWECLYLMRKCDVQPDVYTYTTLIQALAACGGESRRCLRELRKMQQQGLAPNKVTYTVTLQALCRDNQPQAAWDLLKEMQDSGDQQLSPDVVTYSTLIDGWASMAKMQPEQAVNSVMQLLDEMKQRSIRPNEQTYTSVLSALAHAHHLGSSRQAAMMIQRMQSEGVPINIIHYNALINAISKSTNVSKVAEARQVWQQMLSFGLELDIISYNSLLSVAANAFGAEETRKQGFDLAMEVFQVQQNNSGCEATSLTFHYLFKAIRKLMPRSKEQTELTQRIFELCCEQGCLNDIILKSLHSQICTNQEFQKLFGVHWKEDPSLADLPSSWSQNALPVRPSKWVARSTKRRAS